MSAEQPQSVATKIFRVVFGALALWFVWVTLAAAHASLTGTNPTDGAVVGNAPAHFVLSFSEPVSPLKLQLFKPDGSSVALDRFLLRDNRLEIDAPATLERGTHVISWRVISEDGHPVGGSVIFSIGAPSAAPPPPDDAVDWSVRSAIWIGKIVIYLGYFFGVGGVFAVHWLTTRAAGSGRFTVAMLVLGMSSIIVSAGLQGLDALGAPLGQLLVPVVWKTGLGTSFGRTVLVMMAAMLLALIGQISSPRTGRWVSLMALLAGALALALSGHASAADPQWLTRTSVFLHAAGIALWVGALVPLGSVLRVGGPSAVDGLRRFSFVIPFVVVSLVAAGFALAVIQVQRPAALAGTAYGNVLLVKLALLVALFLLAAFNRWRLTASVNQGDLRAARNMVRSIAIEIVVVVAILAVAATWRFTPPPRALAIAAAQPVSTHLHSEKAMAEVTVTPGHAGPVEVSAFLMASEFDHLNAKEVTFVFSNPAAGIEPIKRSARRGSDGVWRSENVLLPLPGKWTIRVDILISDFDLARISGEIELKSGLGQ